MGRGEGEGGAGRVVSMTYARRCGVHIRACINACMRVRVRAFAIGCFWSSLGCGVVVQARRGLVAAASGASRKKQWALGQ